MSSAAHDRNNAAAQPGPDRTSADSDAASPSTQGLLDEVLRETLARASRREQVTPEDIRAMTALTVRYEGHLSAEAAADLVQTLLKSRFPQWEKAPSHWERMCQEIAATLRDDPPTWQRVEAIWARLCEVKP